MVPTSEHRFPSACTRDQQRAHKAPAYMEPCSVRQRPTDKEKPPRAQRGKWRPYSRLSNSEADCNRKQLPKCRCLAAYPALLAFCFVVFCFPHFGDEARPKDDFLGPSTVPYCSYCSLLSVKPVPQKITKVLSARSLPEPGGPAPERDLHSLPQQNQARSALHPGRIEAHILNAEWEVNRRQRYLHAEV